MDSSPDNISPVSKLSSFIKKYPKEELHAQFSMLEESFPSHRIVKGDGNCFYRAFAFLYLASNNCDDYKTLFPKVEWSYRKNNSSIQSDQQFQEQLYQVWNKYLRQLSNSKNRADKQRKLETLFNQMQNFDQLMIGYFKSVNYQHLLTQRKTFTPFINSQADFQRELQRVMTFDQESEGIEIYSLTHAMKTKIIVFYVDEKNFVPIEYMENLEDKGLFLFYRPGHYDIIYPFETQSHQSQIQQNSKEDSWKNFKTSFKEKQPSIALKQKPSKASVNPISAIGSKLGVDAKFREQKIMSGNISSSKNTSFSEIKTPGQQRKNTYFQTNEYANNGKYDLRYKQTNDQNLDDTRASNSSASSRQPNFPKVTRPPVIIQSWTDPIQRASMQLLGVGALLLVSYAIYYYLR